MPLNEHEMAAFRSVQSGDGGSALKYAARGVRARARQAASAGARAGKRVGQRAMRKALGNLKKQFSRLQQRRRKYMTQLKKRRAKVRAGKSPRAARKPRTEVGAGEVPAGAVLRKGKRGGSYYVSETGQKVYVREGG